MDFLTLDKFFVLDNFKIVQDKKYFVRADGRGNGGSKSFLGFAYIKFEIERESVQAIHSEEFILIILELSTTKNMRNP